jgi:aromatic-L-amino-acid/L-tryptophan decarboxylase
LKYTGAAEPLISRRLSYGGCLMDVEEFRKHGHYLIDWLANYHARLRELPVQPPTLPGEVRALLPDKPPRQAEPFEACIGDLDRVVVPHLSHWQHPLFFGYFPANAMLAGVLGDLASTGLGVLGLSWQSSPALSEVEEVVVDWFRQMVDLSPQWTGVINDTASSSSLIALISAREKATKFSLARQGMQGEKRRHIVYASAGSHSSVEKAALLAGFGRENVRLIPLDNREAIRLDSLRRAIDQDLDAGLNPCALVACVGGTAAASVDPIRECSDIANCYNLWLHVDAAMAGAAMILPECRWMWDGIEGADSLVINAHKWIGAPFDCSLYYVRDEAHLIRVMSTNPAYLQSTVDGQVRNLRNSGIPLGRRFRALKLWFVIREQGVVGLQERLRRDIANAKRLSAEIAGTPGWHVVAPVDLQTVCVRHEPEGITGEALDRHTRAWAEAVNSSGSGYLTPAILGGRWMVRISIGAPSTTWSDVQAIWRSIKRHADAIVRQGA